MLPAAFGPGARRRDPPPTPAAALWSGGHPAARLGPAQGAAYGYRGMRPVVAGSRPRPFSRAVGLRAARPLAARAATPTRRPPRRRSGPPGVRGSRSLRPGPAVPSTVDALPLCPLLPGWPPGGRSAPGSRAPGRRGSPRRSRRRRSGPGGPRGAAAATGRLGSALPPRAGARPPVSVFLLRVPPGRWGQGAKNAENGAKMGENGRKTEKIVEKPACRRYNNRGANRMPRTP